MPPTGPQTELQSDYEYNLWLNQCVNSDTYRDKEISVELFKLEIASFQQNIKFLVARELVKLFPEQIKWFDLVVYLHLSHPLEEIMFR